MLPGDRAAKVDSKFATKCRQNFLLTVGRADSTSCVFVVAFGLYDVDNSGLIDESEFSELARNTLVGQANGVRANRIQLRIHSQHGIGRRSGRHDFAACSLRRGIFVRVSGRNLQERQLTSMIQEEFRTADTDNDGMVSLEEWRTAASTQPRIVKCAFFHIQTRSRRISSARGQMI